jgi:recombinational DNA repair ATPase RecF
LDRIFVKTEAILGKITGEAVTLKFQYQSGQKPWTQRGLKEIQGRLCDELLAPDRVRAEVATGITLTGPHRHDLSFLFNGNDSRIFCSQGQQRALILAFKIAEIVYHSEAFGSYPLLLLDDVLSEFDESKRRFLIEFLQSNEAQTFLTTTDQSHLKDAGLKLGTKPEVKQKNETVYRLEAGKVASET